MMERLSKKDKLGYFVPENVMYGDPFLMGEVRGYAIDRLAYYEDLEEQGRLVEVVRCKDCKHFRRNLENDTYCNCVGGLTDPEENDFCTYAEQAFCGADMRPEGGADRE